MLMKELWPGTLVMEEKKCLMKSPSKHYCLVSSKLSQDDVEIICNRCIFLPETPTFGW